jgi:hypothetical protein
MADFKHLIPAIRRLEAMTEANNEKYGVLRGTLYSWMDIHLARTEAKQEKKKGCQPKRNDSWPRTPEINDGRSENSDRLSRLPH